jgi:hypothetical protein
MERDELSAAGRTAARGHAKAPTRKHLWMAVGSMWQCASCMSTALSDTSASRRRRERCPGKANRLRQVLADPKGHQLAVADVDGGPCVLCVACGAWCRQRPRKLTEWCKGRAGREAAGGTALGRFKQGYLPSDGLDVTALQRRVDGVRPLTAQAVAHWDSWREPAWREAAVEPELPDRNAVVEPMPPQERCSLLPSWRAGCVDTETTPARRRLIASLQAAIREGQNSHD